MFERGTPGNTFATFPTRVFTFILDPNCLPLAQQAPFAAVLQLISDLRFADPPVAIHILLPTYLADPNTRTLANATAHPFVRIPDPKGIPPFSPDAAMPQDYRDRLTENSEVAQRAVGLLALADISQADGIVTQIGALVEARYSLHQHHRIRIIPLDEFANIVEACAHGHSIFWSATNLNRRLEFDIFYQMTHWKCARLFKWFNAIQTKITNDELKENLRIEKVNSGNIAMCG